HDSKLSILDYPVVFDDDLYFTFEIQSRIKVLEIYEKEASPWLKLLFGEDEFVAFNSMQRQNLDFQSLNDYNVIIINEIDEIHSGLQLQLSAFTDQGGSLVLLPSQKNTQAYAMIASNYGFNYDLSQDTAKTRVFSVDESDKLFKDVFVKIPENADFPTVFKHFSMHLQNASSAKILIQLLNGNPFLISNVAGNGKVYAFSSPIQLTWTDFQRNSLFVPVWYRILLMSIRNAPLYYNLGEEVIIATPYHQTTGEKILKFRSLSSDFEIIPEHRNRNNSAEVLIHDVIPTAGQFALFSSDSLTQMLSFNFNRKESILTYFQADELLNSAIL
ncbi:MAG: hypothetical protein Q8T08_23690, partial [Ignavibacteria bacterium]|nr:hypothetical protein [Ignavibacteria bacterium]